jgi:hypothetical protein
MLNVKTSLIIGSACLFIGMVSGYSIHATFLCPNTDKAVVKQIKKDGKKLVEVREKIKVKYVYRDKIKTVIKTIPSDECFDRPIPDSATDGLLDAFHSERP